MIIIRTYTIIKINYFKTKYNFDIITWNLTLNWKYKTQYNSPVKVDGNYDVDEIQTLFMCYL